VVETAKYEVILKEDGFEIRKYEKMLIATARDASSKFQVLFRYITGSNTTKSKIDMTSPVITSEKIAMTSPVLSNKDTMSFVVPSEYEMDSVPEPTDPRINIEEVPERYVAAVRFRGFAWKDSVNMQTEKLLKILDEKEITLKGSPFLMQYNPPYIPGFLRRNEVGVEIEYDG
jgi:hypothetical protein